MFDLLFDFRDEGDARRLRFLAKMSLLVGFLGIPRMLAGRYTTGFLLMGIGIYSLLPETSLWWSAIAGGWALLDWIALRSSAKALEREAKEAEMELIMAVQRARR